MFPPAKEYPDSYELMILKVFAMLLGEIELMNIPFSELAWQRCVEMLFLFTFLILIVLVLQNLLNALAFKDTKDMLDASNHDKLLIILELALFWGDIFFKHNWTQQTVLSAFEEKKIYFPIFHPKYKNNDNFPAMGKCSEDSFSNDGSNLETVVEIKMKEHRVHKIKRMKYERQYKITKRIAENAKKIISERKTSHENESIEDIIKVILSWTKVLPWQGDLMYLSKIHAAPSKILPFLIKQGYILEGAEWVIGWDGKKDQIKDEWFTGWHGEADQGKH